MSYVVLTLSHCGGSAPDGQVAMVLAMRYQWVDVTSTEHVLVQGTGGGRAVQQIWSLQCHPINARQGKLLTVIWARSQRVIQAIPRCTSHQAKSRKNLTGNSSSS